jgi:TonB-linked SusC/RagA family outer membrane protein
MKKSTNRFLLLAVLSLCSVFAFSQSKKTVTGVIRDASGAGIPGVSVTEKGSKTSGTFSDDLGKFSISVNNSATLIFSAVGYATKEVAVGSNTTLNVSLATSANELSEVVVTSMGIGKQKKSLGYATTSIKAEELVKTAPTNIATALYGKAPGVKIAAAPGGSTSGVSIQIRGLSSLTLRTQPLIVMDGVPIHDGDFNNSNYWGDQRLRGNALIDINPEDIESLTVLKGASAAALYGSEATNGVIVITTKSGKGKKGGFSVDVNATYFQDRVAYLPRFQKVRGPGFNPAYGVYSSDENGFTHYNLNGTDYRTNISGSLNFGPKFDGQPILAWDGSVRPYSYQENGYENLFQHANNTVENIALSNVSENSTTRFSVTHQGYEGVSLNSKNNKVVISLNSTYKFGSKFRTQLIVNDIWQKVHNRPYSDDRLVNNFTGMMPSFDDGAWYQEKAQTSLGYKYVTGSNQSLTPDENLKYGNYRTDILDYMWNVKHSNVDENNNRLLASLTSFWDITKGLELRGRIATDWTSGRTETRNDSNIPGVFGFSGSYGIGTNEYNILYGDLLLTYSHKLNENFDFKVMGGYTADKESSFTTNVSTRDGLTVENRFDLTSSATTPYNSGSGRSYLTKEAYIGTINLNYKGFWYVEGTMRRDRTSTMNPDQNSFFYPSVNSSFVISDAFTLPSFISQAKLRGSWGIVGNYPAAYQANVAYSLGNLGNQGSGSSTLTTTAATGTYGNDRIKPEKKHELEFGLEAGLFANRLNLDIAYYNNKIVDQILPLQLAQATGASNILTNIGTLQNYGVEFSLNGDVLKDRGFSWNAGLNLAFNHNKILKLTNGSNELIAADYDGNAAVLKSVVGNPIGDLYAHPIATNDAGEKIVNDYGDGTLDYKIDGTKLIKYGNVQPKAIGGFYNTFTYKSFSLNIYTDFRIGGYVMPTGLNWMTGRGLTEESLNGMDKAHGGVSYYLDASGYGVQTNAAAGPNGEKVYDDGMLLEGVLPDGSKNTHVESQAIYYWYVYNWGGPQYANAQYFKYIVKNSYWKVREISVSYSLPDNLVKKLRAKDLTLSVFGRNLFYITRTIKDMDSEQLTTGLRWDQQVNNAGTNPSTRTVGISLRASF